MKIGFFEEFPIKNNLSKLKLIDFPVELYIAAKSLGEFKKIRKKSKIKNLIYWPILEKEEGYWLSPFSRRKALKRIIDELKRNKEQIRVLWDAELPFKKGNWKKEIHNFIRNKILIKKFIKSANKYNKEIITAEYPLENKFFVYLSRFLALSFNPKKYKHKKIDMLYTSLIKNKTIEQYLEKQISKGKKIYENNYYVGFGTIGKGILGNEEELTNNELKRDLNIAKKNKIENVIIYRLGGINKKRVSIIKEFLKNKKI